MYMLNTEHQAELSIFHTRGWDISREAREEMEKEEEDEEDVGLIWIAALQPNRVILLTG